MGSKAFFLVVETGLHLVNRMKFIFVFGILLLGLCSCYQMRSDDLSTVPVTNNPTIVPQHGNLGQFTALHP